MLTIWCCLYALVTSMFSDLSSVEDCTDSISTWFMENALLLNPTQRLIDAVIFGTNATTSGGFRHHGCRQRDRKHCTVQRCTQVAWCDAWFLAVVWQVRYQHCPRLHFAPPCVTLLTLEAAKAIAASIVGSRLDYCQCNSLLIYSRHLGRPSALYKFH